MTTLTVKPVADRALLVELATQISDDTSRKVGALDRMIAQAQIDGVLEVVPALVNLLVIFDPLKTDHQEVEAAIRTLPPAEALDDTNAAHHILDVYYDAELFPDLADVAKVCDLSSEAVINAHCGAKYRVGMYGFVPGYAYLAGIPKAIQVPRKTVPLRDVPAGRILIAGPQCIASTMIMPTGWSIIGQTNAQIITDDPDRPFLFDLGDTVSFNRIRREDL